MPLQLQTYKGDFPPTNESYVANENAVATHLHLAATGLRPHVAGSDVVAPTLWALGGGEPSKGAGAMAVDAVLLARLQFAFTIAFHIYGV